jgi:serine/threonine-protein kinase
VTTETNIVPPRYRGARRIARGGMGEIYRATDDTLGRAVAIKVLGKEYSEDDDVRARFTREALAAARLSGEPHTVTIFDVGEWNDRPFIVMEYLSGGSLEDRLRSGPPEPGQTLEWLDQAARALDAAHGNGIVHRDVKPGNLLLDRGGNVQVADFGIASAAGMDALTKPGTVLGTAGYLAPEQARGERATPATDRYALAVVAWELLTGRRPFAADSPTAEASAHVSAPVPAISDRNPSLPTHLDPVFARALAKDPDERYGSSAEFVGELRDAFERAAGTTRELAPVASAAETTEPRPARAVAAPRVQRRRSLVPLAALGLLALAGGGVAVAALANDDGGQTTRTFVTTVLRTTPTKTVERPVTVTAEPEPEPPPPPPPEPPPAAPQPPPAAGASLAQGRRLTDQATALMNEGDYSSALPLAQNALSMLQGSGDPYEGYANYDVGRSLAELGRCDEAIPYLEKRLALLGKHPEVTKALRKCGVKG